MATVLLSAVLTSAEVLNTHQTVDNKLHGKILTNAATAVSANCNSAATHGAVKKTKFNNCEKIRGVNLGGWLVLEPCKCSHL